MPSSSPLHLVREDHPSIPNPENARATGEPQTLTGVNLESKLVQAAGVLRAVLCELPNYDIVVHTPQLQLKDCMLAYPILICSIYKQVPVLLSCSDVSDWSKTCHLTPSIPVHPMLAQPTKVTLPPSSTHNV